MTSDARPERRRTSRGTPAITYWIWAERAPDVSPFCGFSRAALEQAGVVAGIAELPMNVFELFSDKARAGFARMYGGGGYRIQIVDPVYLPEVRLYPANPFSVFVSDATTVTKVEEAVRRAAYPVFHVTTASTLGVEPFANLGRESIRGLYERVLEYLEETGAPEWTLLPKLRDRCVEWTQEHCGVPRIQHGVTIPNEIALQSLHFTLVASDPLPPVSAGEGGSPTSSANLPIVAVLKASVAGLRSARGRISSQFSERPLGPPVDTIVWSSGVQSRLSVPEGPGKALPPGLLPALRALLTQRDYPTFTNQTPSTLKSVFGSPAARAIVQVRRQELAMCTAAIGLMAAGSFSPVVRVRPAVNLIKGRMRQLAACAAAQGPRRHQKLSKLARRIGEALVAEIGPECMELIGASQGSVKLITNAPLELLPAGDLPLHLRFTVSRVPVTPARVFLSHTIGSPEAYVSPADLSEVLIVRSFSDGDPIKRALETATAGFLEIASRKLSVRIVDVASADEFAEAVNTFSGRILIFDGHGTHEDKDGIGFLELGGEQVDARTIASKVKQMPPIVVLSACSTHPLDWSEDSSAVAFLAMGAVSVLGTITPVLAADAAVFVGRLLLRLAEFVPLIAASGQRWSDVVSGLLRMSYVTDILFAFQSAGLISDNDARRLQFDANMLINSRTDEWFEPLLVALSSAAGRSVEQVRSFWLENAYFTSAMRYVHLGSPERIVIIDDDGEDEAWRLEPSPVRGMVAGEPSSA